MKLQFHPDVASDSLTVSEFSLVQKLLAGMKENRMPCPEEVAEVEAIPGFLRWKPSPKMRHTCDVEPRVIFKINDDDTVFVLMACSRTDKTYHNAQKRAQTVSTR